MGPELRASWGGLALLVLTSCVGNEPPAVCATAPLADMAAVTAAIADTDRAQPTAKAVHRVGGGVEVFLYSHLENQGDFDSLGSDEEQAFLAAVAPGMPSECPRSEKVLIARVWEVASGAFTRAGAREKLVVVRIDRCRSPESSWIVAVLADNGAVVARFELPAETTVASAPDPFAEGRRSLVLATKREHQVVARIARAEGDRLVTLGESEPLDTRCRSAATAGWFYGVASAGKPVSYRTAKSKRCEP